MLARVAVKPVFGYSHRQASSRRAPVGVVANRTNPVNVIGQEGQGAGHTSGLSRPASGGYLLPIKRAVRRTKAVDVGDAATVTIELIDL